MDMMGRVGEGPIRRARLKERDIIGVIILWRTQ